MTVRFLTTAALSSVALFMLAPGCGSDDTSSMDAGPSDGTVSDRNVGSDGHHGDKDALADAGEDNSAEEAAADASEDSTADAEEGSAADAAEEATTEAGKDSASDAPSDVTSDARGDSPVDATGDSPADVSVDSPSDAAQDSSPADAAGDSPVEAGCVTANTCPLPSSVCDTATCSGSGVCGAAHDPLGTACNSGGTVCNAAGVCVACNTPSDCPGTGNECIVATCSGGNACGTSDLDSTHAIATQAPGDCQKTVCNGAGSTMSVDDPTDLPTSNTACKIDPACSGSPLAPTFTNAPTGADCSSDNVLPKHLCNATGACVECNVDEDCGIMSDGGGFNLCVSNVCEIE
jgi:hypothetical protein